jgi:hypothetical protein
MEDESRGGTGTIPASCVRGATGWRWSCGQTRRRSRVRSRQWPSILRRPRRHCASGKAGGDPRWRPGPGTRTSDAHGLAGLEREAREPRRGEHIETRDVDVALRLNPDAVHAQTVYMNREQVGPTSSRPTLEYGFTSLCTLFMTKHS